ncbi:unnamed protein product [Rhizophagus irregularis]|nr:unnamed protein product [Rhizophagus irregularis]CAB5369721.1 unnamed protein product [Rhizophagus irregularis]
MWTCNICFKTFDRSTSYYNHHRSHNFNYKISSSEQETSSDEESSEEFSSNQIFSEKDNIYIYNNNDEGDESNDDEESYESDKVEESSKSDENEIISDNLPVPIIEHSIPTTNINEMANSTFSKNDDQTSSDSDEQNFLNEIYRDFVKLVVHHKLSNNVGDAFLKFLRTPANFPKKTLPPSTRIGLQFLDKATQTNIFSSIHPAGSLF